MFFNSLSYTEMAAIVFSANNRLLVSSITIIRLGSTFESRTAVFSDSISFNIFSRCKGSS